MSQDNLFVFGTLCHAPLRDIVLGPAENVVATPARLSGHAVFWKQGADHPLLAVVPGGEASGLLLSGLTAEHRARLDFFEAGFAYDPVEVVVETADGPVTTRHYATEPEAQVGEAWSLSNWADQHAPLWCAAAREMMSYFGQIDAQTLAARLPMIRLRAGSWVRAQETAPTTVRSENDVAQAVDVVRARKPYSNYFLLEEQDLRFRRFDGIFSPVVNRAGFVGGDAVTVLPYDARRDAVLLVEQFRVGPYLRGDPNPWVLEPIAGRVDPGEAVETTARREALEEAGLSLGALHYVSGHYPSPGAVTEFVYSYVAEADLDGIDGRVAGVSSEAENIRSHVVPFDHLMTMVESGEAGAGPLVVSAYWLALNRPRLRDAG